MVVVYDVLFELIDNILYGLSSVKNQNDFANYNYYNNILNRTLFLFLAMAQYSRHNSFHSQQHKILLKLNLTTLYFVQFLHQDNYAFHVALILNSRSNVDYRCNFGLYSLKGDSLNYDAPLHHILNLSSSACIITSCTCVTCYTKVGNQMKNCQKSRYIYGIPSSIKCSSSEAFSNSTRTIHNNAFPFTDILVLLFITV